MTDAAERSAAWTAYYESMSAAQKARDEAERVARETYNEARIAAWDTYSETVRASRETRNESASPQEGVSHHRGRTSCSASTSQRKSQMNSASSALTAM